MSVTTSASDRVDVDVMADGAISVSQAVEFSGVPRSSLYEAMNRGELAFTKVGKRRLIPRRALVALLRVGLKAVK